MEDFIKELLYKAVHYVIVHDTNPYLTKETIVQRLYKSLSEMTRVPPALSTSLFGEWHDEILAAYEQRRPSLSHEERAHVERVLSKDSPQVSELVKFASCWYKYDPITTCRWFAVDGLLGPHPKNYAYDAFTTTHAAHHRAVRSLYEHTRDPETLRQVIERAFRREQPSDDPRVQMYAERVGEEGMRAIEAERSNRLAQQQSNKRRAKAGP